MKPESKYDSYHQIGKFQKSQSNLVNSSFFDDPNKLNSTFWNQIIGTQHQQHFTQKDVEGVLFKSSKGYFKERFVAICQDRLVIFDDEGTVARKYIDLNNSTVEKLKFQKQEDGKYGFKLCRNLRALEFYVESEQLCVIWISYLKRSCVQRHFQNEYNVTKLLGKGTTAKVYAATKKSNGQSFAVKIFDKSKFAETDKIALVKELSIMRRLEHKNIIKLHEVYENDQYIFLVSEYLEGGELLLQLKVIKEFNGTVIAQLLQNLFSALAYLHQNNIIHRDIKPENLVLKNKNDLTEICIADFGLAEYQSQWKNFVFRRCGTPGYVAPEILKDLEYDHKVDIFSAGVIMFTLFKKSFSGITPFYSTTYDETLEKNTLCQVDFTLLNGKISEDGINLIKLLLDANPKERPEAIEVLNNNWFQTTSIKQEQRLIFSEIQYSTYQPQENKQLFSKTPYMNQCLSRTEIATPNQFQSRTSSSPPTDRYLNQNMLNK